jgi:single-stranded DNA-binding protein
MITLSKTRFGKYLATGVGKITTDPQYKTVGKNETPVCTFLLQSDTKKSGNVKEYDNFSVCVWGDDSAYASQLEKGDEIYIVGECKRDDYWSNRNNKEEFQINAEMIIPKNIGLVVLQLQMALKAMSDGEEPKKTAKDFDDMNYSNIEIPPEFLEDMESEI